MRNKFHVFKKSLPLFLLPNIATLVEWHFEYTMAIKYTCYLLFSRFHYENLELLKKCIPNSSAEAV